MPSHCDQDNLQEIGTSDRTIGYYKKGKFLTMTGIHRCLSSYQDVNIAGKTMMENIDSIRSDGLLQVPIEFPVLALQHVTSHEDAKKILESRSFKGRKHESCEFNDLSFWSADVSSDDIETVRLKAYETIRRKVKPKDMETFHEEIKEQFVNSPAFNKSASCYGNFKFSFPFSFLLYSYKQQHCNGGEPHLRILGTDIYKQEIAHYIVVHGPGTKDFDDLPMVPTMQTSSHDHVVWWMDETLYWRPESTSSSLHLMISGDSCTHIISQSNGQLEPQPNILPHVASCVWNHLVLAFHLPNYGELNIPVQQLLRNLTPCHALQPFLRSDPIQKHQARELIRTLHERFSPNSRKLNPPQPEKIRKCYDVTKIPLEDRCKKMNEQQKVMSVLFSHPSASKKCKRVHTKNVHQDSVHRKPFSERRENQRNQDPSPPGQKTPARFQTPPSTGSEDWEDCPDLGPSWERRTIIRKSGKTSGRLDTYYRSPLGQTFRTKKDLSKYMEGKRDLSRFNFKQGTFLECPDGPSTSRENFSRLVAGGHAVPPGGRRHEDMGQCVSSNHKAQNLEAPGSLSEEADCGLSGGSEISPIHSHSHSLSVPYSANHSVCESQEHRVTMSYNPRAASSHHEQQHPVTISLKGYL